MEHFWQDKTGEVHIIEQMETSHIQNCISLIYAYHLSWRPEYLASLKSELRKRKLKRIFNTI